MCSEICANSVWNKTESYMALQPKSPADFRILDSGDPKYQSRIKDVVGEADIFCCTTPSD
jgi:hypothetical protein